MLASRISPQQVAAAALAAALVLPACGGGDDGDASADADSSAEDSDADDSDDRDSNEDGAGAATSLTDAPEDTAATLCTLVDPADVAAAVGLDEVGTRELTGLDPMCAFTGPDEGSGDLNVDFDRPLSIALVEVNNFSPPSNFMDIEDADASEMYDNDEGWFSILVVVGDQQLRVEAGTTPDGVQYDTPELRALAEAAALTWVAAQ